MILLSFWTQTYIEYNKNKSITQRIKIAKIFLPWVGIEIPTVYSVVPWNKCIPYP